MTVAYELGQPLSEVSKWSIVEVQYWLAYFVLHNKRQRDAEKKASKQGNR